MLRYRPLAEPDIERAVALEAYSFQSNPDRSDLARGKVAQFRGLFDDDRLLAQLELIPLRLRTGAGEVAAAGIGSVASAPEGRRRGHVDTLMRELAAELHAAAVPLGVLYPFKTSFYGRQGWGTFLERRRFTGAPDRFASFKPGAGGFVPVGPDQIAELDRIYSGALRGRFGMLARDEIWWREQVLQDWNGRPYHAFMWRDDQGVGRSYLIFRIEGDGASRRLECREIVALDPVARAQLFAFLAGHEDQVATVRFIAPADAPVNMLLPDPLECAMEPYFMLRLFDVPAALAAHTYPADVAGRLILAVRDPWLPANQGVYELEFAERRCAVRRLADNSPADLACDVGALAQIYSRYLRPRTAAAFGVLEVASRSALELAGRAFAGLAPFCSDFF